MHSRSKKPKAISDGDGEVVYESHDTVLKAAEFAGFYLYAGQYTFYTPEPCDSIYKACEHNLFHREDGPACIEVLTEPIDDPDSPYHGGAKAEYWHRHGEWSRKDGPAQLWYYPDDTVLSEEWFLSNYLHRSSETGFGLHNPDPARIFYYPDGSVRRQEWWVIIEWESKVPLWGRGRYENGVEYEPTVIDYNPDGSSVKQWLNSLADDDGNLQDDYLDNLQGPALEETDSDGHVRREWWQYGERISRTEFRKQYRERREEIKKRQEEEAEEQPAGVEET